jgi:hypothetical protein
MHQFSRRLFGADAREVREFLAETAAEFDRTKAALARAHAERDTLQNRLREVAAEIDKLRGQLAAAQEKSTASQAREDLAAHLAAERDALQTTLRHVTAEADKLRGQLAAAQEKSTASQAREDLAARLAVERDALAAVRDSLQNRLKEATAEVHRLREQAVAARDKIEANQARKNLAAQLAAERDALRKRLTEVTAEALTLREQVTAAQEKLAAHQAEDREIAQALLNAQKAADDLMHSARTQAADTARKATAAADETIQSARTAAAETLRKAHAHAEGAVRAAEQTAAARLAELEIEAESKTEEVRRATAAIELSAEEYVAGLATQIETVISSGHLLRTLTLLGENLAGALETVTRLETAAQSEVLPALHRLVERLRESLAARHASSPSAPAPAEGQGPPPPGSDDAARRLTRAQSEAHDQILPTLRALVEIVREGVAAAEPAGHSPQDRVVPLGVRGEIVVSPVRTHYRAAKIAEAVSRIKGIRAARLRALLENAANIEVITEEGPLTGIDFTVIDGVPMDVVDATDARLVLRVARTLSQSTG